MRAANRGWGQNLAPRADTHPAMSQSDLPGDEATSDVGDSETPAPGSSGDEPTNEPTKEPRQGDPVGGGTGGSGTGGGEPWLVHPIGVVAGVLLIVAVLYHTVFETKYLIGDLETWHWVALVVTVAMSLWPTGLNGLRIGIDSIASVTKRISMALAWVVFIVQLFNVVTRYGTRYVEQDILIGQATSLAWQSFAALFLLGVNYGIRDGVNPRIDFWWANFTDKTKASIDFVLHTLLFLPFVFMAIRILQPYAAIALGRKRDGTWPSGYRVWETWEQSSDADQLPVGPIKALLLVGFVLIGIQLISELIKTGFVIAGRRRYGNLASSDAPLRIE